MKILNTALGILGSRFLGRPFYARFHVTYRCNYRCRMCGVPERGAGTAELPLADVAVVAGRLRELGSRHAVLTGGEPFLRPDLPRVIEAFARRGFSVRTLELSRELLPRGISLANVVASPLNFASLPELVEFFAARGVYSYITPVMIRKPQTDADDYLFRGGDERFLFADLDPAVRDGVIDRLAALRRLGSGLLNSTRSLEDFRSYLADGRTAWTCEAGRFCLDVRPDGGVAACKEKPSLGNILDPSFIGDYRRGSFLSEARRLAAS